TLGVATSTYYHGARKPPRDIADEQLTEQIKRVFYEHKRRYGYRRVYQVLHDNGHACSPNKVRRLMKENGLRALYHRSFVPRTSDGKASKPSPNLLLDLDSPITPDQVWVGDITYIPGESRWYYMALVMDLYSRRIVGVAVADHMRSELVEEAMREALESRCPSEGLIFHSDRGSQYGSKAFRQLLEDHQIKQSMSRKADPYDNAFMESAIGTFKNELVVDGKFANWEDAKLVSMDYCYGYYNTIRMHSSLGNMSPSAYEKIALTKQ
ncbi:MAG: IS3 family transposase, partial [Verrucomicrobiota bacterium]